MAFVWLLEWLVLHTPWQGGRDGMAVEYITHHDAAMLALSPPSTARASSPS